jgi:hypothetical protein
MGLDAPRLRLNRLDYSKELRGRTIGPGYVHRGHRRNHRLLRFFLILWFTLVAAFTAAAALDLLLDVGWGYTMSDVRAGTGMIAFGCLFWLFARAIMAINLSISRRVYGPEPADPPE